MNILHHSTTLAANRGPAYFRCGRGEHPHQSHSKNAILCLTLEAHHLGQEASLLRLLTLDYCLEMEVEK